MDTATAIAAISVPMFSFGMVIVVVWLLVRAGQRRNELRADVQMKLIEKFGSSTEFVHFLESPAGREFLHQPLKDTRSRVIGGITTGTVLTLMGLGFVGIAIAFQEPGNLVPAFILIALGAGFFVSSILSMRMSKQLSSDLTQPQS
jgi:type IV secretory pathway VirB3-like protein